MPVIRARRLSKKYQIYLRPWDKLVEIVRLSRTQLH